MDSTSTPGMFWMRDSLVRRSFFRPLTIEGEIYGGEFTANYQHGGFSSYLNIGYEYARYAR
jgi:hypothetical protein